MLCLALQRCFSDRRLPKDLEEDKIHRSITYQTSWQISQLSIVFQARLTLLSVQHCQCNVQLIRAVTNSATQQEEISWTRLLY